LHGARLSLLPRPSDILRIRTSSTSHPRKLKMGKCHDDNGECGKVSKSFGGDDGDL